MNRKKWRIIIGSLLVLALIVGVQGAVLAKATKVEVYGRGEVTSKTGTMRWDKGGNLHVLELVCPGTIWLETVDGEPILNGEWEIVLRANMDYEDESYTGPGSGTIVITEGETVLWEGRIHGYFDRLILSGKITAHGRDRFEGMQLQLDVQEDSPIPGGNQDPDLYTLTGRLLDPQGE
jgi:hypothetical protein